MGVVEGVSHCEVNIKDYITAFNRVENLRGPLSHIFFHFLKVYLSEQDSYNSGTLILHQKMLFSFLFFTKNLICGSEQIGKASSSIQ